MKWHYHFLNVDGALHKCNGTPNDHRSKKPLGNLRVVSFPVLVFFFFAFYFTQCSANTNDALDYVTKRTSILHVLLLVKITEFVLKDSEYTAVVNF